MTPLIVIPARLGSARLPGKPLALIGGRAMVLHVRDRALEADIGPVLVACADREIADLVEAEGGIAVMTDPSLPSGSDRVHAACALFDPEQRHDIVINLQGDLPSITPDDIASVLAPLDDPGFDIATLVAPIVSAEERDTPSVVKAACAFADGADVAAVPYFSRAPVPWGDGPWWHHVGIYAFRRAVLSRFVSLPPSALERRERLEQLRAIEAGMRIGCARIASAPFGVDTPHDLERARAGMGA
jgi:3-deoxy-manno-octulosonate cytidylyltransferase (CMP-KDO synthetase)